MALSPTDRDQLRRDVNLVLGHAYNCLAIHYSRHRYLFAAADPKPVSPTLCNACMDALAADLEISRVQSPEFVLSYDDMRALLRQTFRQHITHEGTSGPHLHALLTRLREHLPREIYDEMLRDA